MNRLMLSFVLLACTLSAQDWARQKLDKSTRHGEWVTVQHDGRNVETFVAYPESSHKTPVVLVIHEIFGMSDWVQLMADELAEAGYIAVAPDLLSGMGPNGGGTKSFSSGDERQAISKLPPAQITADLNAVADYALKLPAANGKLFVTGFCWGGGQSFRFATERPDLSAAFVFYGTPPDKDAMAHIPAPVYGFYAGNDERVDATIPAAKTEMAAAGKTYDPVVYDGAGHGFMRGGDQPDGRPGDKKARDEAWVRWKKLLEERSK